MNVLGLSGFGRSLDYKAAVLGPAGDPRLARFCQGMDAAAALVVDGRIAAAAAEERFDRRKHSNRLPTGAIDYCLRAAGLDWGSLDAVAHGFDHAAFRAAFELSAHGRDWYREVLSPDLVAEDLGRAYPGLFDPDKFRPVRHHWAHAASAFYASGFDRALVVVADGMGEVHGWTVFDASGREMSALEEVPFRDSLGLLYGLVTYHLGFDFNADEYKTMGLAPYGDASRFRQAFESIARVRDGRIEMDLLEAEPDRLSWETYAATRRRLTARLCPPRLPGEPLTQEHRDLAASLQELTNRLLTGWVDHWLARTGHGNVCLAGGVALNCVANEKILELKRVRGCFIQPASGDDGAALGAAMWIAARGGDRFNRCGMPFWGPSPDERQLNALAEQPRLAACAHRVQEDESAIARRLARLAAAGRVVALCRGRMEFGPRALGNRSILADPGDPQMRDRVNAAVKKREAFRPFAPVVTEEALGHFFDAGRFRRLPYMLTTCRVRPEWRERLPAVTHVDGSARVQTVAKADHPLLHEALEEMGRLTGVPVLLNTSFNVKDQPIVRTAQEAVDTFLDAPIDALFAGSHEWVKAGRDAV